MSGRIVDCVVIGGGPSGSIASGILGRNGFSTILVDSRKEPGIPVLCGEAISENTLEVAGIGSEGPWIVNKITGYRLRSPSGNDLFSAARGFNIRRDVFDRELLSRAVENGVQYHSGTAVSNVKEEDNVWKVETTNGILSSRSIVMACGVNRHLIPQIIEDNIPETIQTLGAKIKKKDMNSELLFHIKGSLKGGYGWYFPRDDEVSIGIVSNENINEEFDWALKLANCERRDIVSYHGGEIPISGPMKNYLGENCILVGDAGGFSNPISKGGIVGALLSGKEGAMALTGSLSGSEGKLEEWSKDMLEHPAFSSINLERMKFLSSLNDRTLDSLTEIADGRDIWSIRKTELLKEAWKRPDLLRSIRGTLHLARGGRAWSMWAF